jgi:hypothetical protein
MIRELRKESPSETSAAAQRHVSQTVLLITVCFVILHTVSSIYYVIIKIMEEMNENVAEVKGIGANSYMFWSTLPLVNALLNPIILISRSKDLRGKIGAIFRKSYIRNSNSTETRTF